MLSRVDFLGGTKERHSIVKHQSWNKRINLVDLSISSSDVFTFLIECATNQIVENGACTDCEPGKQPNMDRNECMDCPSDKVSEDGAMCMICSDMLIPNNGLTACVGKL